jgi:hypothetical protein
MENGKKKNAEQGKKKTLQEQHSKKRNGDAPVGYSGQTALRREQCDVFALCRPPLPHQR